MQNPYLYTLQDKEAAAKAKKEAAKALKEAYKPLTSWWKDLLGSKVRYVVLGLCYFDVISCGFLTSPT
jgi:hypothetical protein